MTLSRPSPTEHWIATPDGRLFAHCWQPPAPIAMVDASPIVLFHDSLGCVALWRSFPGLLAELTGRTVIAYDRLGFGQSDARRDTLGRDFIDEEASRHFPALQRYFGFDRFIAMGHSVGGGMAVHCAARYATDCAALITESAQAFVEDKTRAGIMTAREHFHQDDAFERLARYHGDKARWVLDAWIETWLAPFFADWSLQAALPLVQCPTLVIHGAEDEYGSLSHPEQIANGVSGYAELKIFPETQHVPHREQEVAVAQTIASFIQSHC